MNMVGYYHPRSDEGEAARRLWSELDPTESFYIPLPGGQVLPVGTSLTFVKDFTKEKSPTGIAFEVVRHTYRDDEPEALTHVLKVRNVWAYDSTDGLTPIVNWLRSQQTKPPKA